MSKRMGVLVSKLSVRLLLLKLAMQSLVQSLGTVTVGDAKPEQVDMVFRAFVATSGTKPRQTQLIALFCRVIAKIPHQQAGMVRQSHKNRAMTKQQLEKRYLRSH